MHIYIHAYIYREKGRYIYGERNIYIYIYSSIFGDPQIKQTFRERESNSNREKRVRKTS
tara:strand:- start:781 stop:957 length:177 start_codon:yes stop_codon:yes gene_type:complete